MEIVIGIIFILLVTAFWRRILIGLVCGLIQGFIWGLFGAAPIGFGIGFFIGLTAKEDAEKKGNKKVQDAERKADKEVEDEKDPPKSNKPKSSDSRESVIIRCPSCRKKLRVRLPLEGKQAKCGACSSSFSTSMDDHGNIKVDKLTDDTASKSSQGRAAIADYFKVLGIEPSATPDEVRAAYKKKILEYHPDRVTCLGEKLKQVADAESKSINAAYSELKSKGLAN